MEALVRYVNLQDPSLEEGSYFIFRPIKTDSLLECRYLRLAGWPPPSP